MASGVDQQRIEKQIEQLSHLTVVKLKNILKKYSLKTSGLKGSLISRIIDNVSIDDIATILQSDDHEISSADSTSKTISKTTSKTTPHTILPKRWTLDDKQIEKLWIDEQYAEYRDIIKAILENKIDSINIVRYGRYPIPVNTFNTLIKLLYINTSIKHIRISNSTLSNESGAILGNMLIHNQIKTLTLTHCNHTNASYLNPWLEPFGDSLLNNMSLEYLEMGHCSLVDNLYLCNGLERNTSIKTLKYRTNDIGNSFEKRFNKVLLHNNTITSLMLIDNLNKNSVVHLVDGCVANKTIRKLYIENYKLSNDDVNRLTYIFNLNHTIDNITLIYGGSEISTWRSLVDVLSKKHLRHLAIRFPTPSDADIVYFTDHFKNSNLESLQIGWVISSNGIKYLTNVLLDNNEYIRRLNLSDNYISNDNIENICRVLIKHKRILNINFNRTYMENIENPIFDLIRENFVEKLNISSNRLGEAMVAGLGDALMNNDTLTNLNISYTDLNNAMAMDMLRGLQYNTTLRSLGIERNNIDPEILKKINDIVHKNNINYRLLSTSLTAQLIKIL